MFRNARDKLAVDVGRPPTPPARQSANASMSNTSPYFNGSSTPARSSKGFLVGKKKPFSAGNSKAKPNASILNFFQKPGPGAPAQVQNGAEMFFRDRRGNSEPTDDISPRERSLSPAGLFLDGGVNLGIQDPLSDGDTPVKRRKLNHLGKLENSPGDYASTSHPKRIRSDIDEVSTEKLLETARTPSENTSRDGSTKPKKRLGGFIDESDSEDEAEVHLNHILHEIEEPVPGYQESMECEKIPDIKDGITGCMGVHSVPSPAVNDSPANSMFSEVNPNDPVPGPPTLKRESTSVFDPGDFDEDFDEDEFFEEGEEYLERRWAQEQQQLELDMMAEEDDMQTTKFSRALPDLQPDQTDNRAMSPPASETTCPICGGSLTGASESEASQHVNSCLDGKPTPLPNVNMSEPGIAETQPHSSRKENVSVPPSRRFQRAAIARPAQETPFFFAQESKSHSAFSKIMSGHAEDAAWAVAAANEVRSRGRPAWERTCPFYKILPGFFICVDGFRYGAVEGCNAYFLSHFHSDHYIGLTASWRHGPVYCSKVTANLVKQQLKVDPKFVRPLEWEETVEVPDTNGVFVTMIPANHCPGSSLFLFEKIIGKGAKPRKQRVLHCGDFRACPAHVNHPLLRPDVLDSISGKTKQQTIDVCYLDTTYLTPKYSFPSQEDVINSCAQMCVSLGKEMVDIGDAWEQVKRERAGIGMVKFLEKEPKTKSEDVKIKAEPSDDVLDDKKTRGRLLVVIGTYSIGKERICLGIARALKSKIYAPPSKQRICLALEDPELASLLTSDPLEAQIHMQMLMEIRAETLADYLQTFKPHFTRIVGFRPTGWNYRPPTSRFTENPAVATVLNSDGWKSRFTMKDLVPQRGSTRESNCFGVPYSEHSSFRELTMFCCALRIGKVIPTVNVGSKKSRERMKMWVEKWEVEKKKNGLFKVLEGANSW